MCLIQNLLQYYKIFKKMLILWNQKSWN
jgi:hypothetical protein